jgi:hypothetical protein
MDLPPGVIAETVMWFAADGTPVDNPDDAATAEVVQTFENGDRLHTIADLAPPSAGGGR